MMRQSPLRMFTITLITPLHETHVFVRAVNSVEAWLTIGNDIKRGHTLGHECKPIIFGIIEHARPFA